MAGDHSSCAIFVLISMLRGQPKTPPSGDDLAVLDYHLKVQVVPKKTFNFVSGDQKHCSYQGRVHSTIKQDKDYQLDFRLGTLKSLLIQK